ncbi:hypothetical protein D8B26_006890 [Coccidioides posadasii str. Silveira]|uniref:uncharacterized protein n=1 Tax=Coccidioides posadasii (strain RMSCC 757 / Silveira) TaxID=443226 RepID=UPI001BEECE9E|nr:hypothetical protein D8B26_006890 [Coccidioides posadasii str. Silveira]
MSSGSKGIKHQRYHYIGHGIYKRNAKKLKYRSTSLISQLPDCIDENLKKIAADLTERAFNKLSPGYQANIQKIIITYGSNPPLRSAHSLATGRRSEEAPRRRAEEQREEGLREIAVANDIG